MQWVPWCKVFAGLEQCYYVIVLFVLIYLSCVDRARSENKLRRSI